MVFNRILLDELVDNQRKNIPTKRKLQYGDMTRILKYTDSSIFSDKCCIWKGYVCSLNGGKNLYINFYFNKRKTQISKILYDNYIGDIESNEFVKNTCESGGKCCNVYHLAKFVKEYMNNSDSESGSDSKSDSNSDSNSDSDSNSVSNSDSNNSNEFKIIF